MISQHDPARPQPGIAGTIVPELLTAKEAAQLVNIGDRTLWRWSHSGLAPMPLKIGAGKRAAVRYRRVELLEWIAAGCPPMDQMPPRGGKVGLRSLISSARCLPSRNRQGSTARPT